jgi:uncharacterized protein YqfA (UPF0365 family)
MHGGLAAIMALMLALFVIALALLFFSVGRVWIQALASGVYVPLVSIVGMKLRKVNPQVIVDALIRARHGGLAVESSAPPGAESGMRDGGGSEDAVSRHLLERHYLAGGNPKNVIDGLAAAKREGIELSLEKACEIDLAGGDIAGAVRKMAEENGGGKNFSHDES